MIVGAGFIGCEAAASLAQQCVTVIMVAPEAAPQENRLGVEAGERLRRLVSRAGVRYVGGVAVEALRDGAVQLDNGVSIHCDLVVAATGVQPQSALAQAAGLDVTDSRIVVGADMQTSVPGIYAAGDVALAFNPSAGAGLPWSIGRTRLIKARSPEPAQQACR